MIKGAKTLPVKHGPAHSAAERGLALVVVLWILVSAALVVSSFNATVRSGASFVASEVKLSKSEALLDAGAEIAATRLIDEEDTRRWLPDGRPRTVSFAGSELTITISDPNRLIDLNKADKDLLLRFFRQFAGSELKAGRIRDRILRARGETTSRARKKDPRRRLSDIREYRKKKSAQPMAFVDIAQLRRLKGMTPEFYKQVAPFLTVYGRDGRINPRAAPNEVLSSIPNLMKTDIARLRDRRRVALEKDATLSEIMRRAGAYLSDAPGPAYVVSVKVRRPGDKYATSKVFVIAPGLDDSAPYRLISKRPLG